MTEQRTILFVCTGNYYRSRFAELLFNARVDQASSWRAESRGFAPSPVNVGPISHATLERLSALGIAHPPVLRRPLLLSEADLESAELIVALDDVEHPPYVDALFPHWSERFVYWQVRDFGYMTVEHALGAIEQAVEQLVRRLAEQKRDINE